MFTLLRGISVTSRIKVTRKRIKGRALDPLIAPFFVWVVFQRVTGWIIHANLSTLFSSINVSYDNASNTTRTNYVRLIWSCGMIAELSLKELLTDRRSLMRSISLIISELSLVNLIYPLYNPI